MARLSYVFDAVREIKRALGHRLPLIGFSGSPFTLACYMIQGSGSSDFAVVRQMIAARPDLMTRLIAINTQAVAEYLNEQIVAGVDVVMLFDTWGGLLSTAAYRAFSLASMREVIATLRPAADGRKIPSIVFTKGGGQWLEDVAACGAQCIGLDWTVDIASARQRVGDRIALQGNLDPAVMLTNPETVVREATAIMHAAGSAPGHIFNLGHGLFPTTPPENVAALVDAVHQASPSARAAA
jgi:uroporphyrinogen decarboxylase